MQSDRGYLSPYFITSAEKMVAEARGRPLLIHEKKLSSLQPLPILKAAVQTAKPLLLVAEDIERRRHRSGMIGGAGLGAALAQGPRSPRDLRASIPGSSRSAVRFAVRIRLALLRFASQGRLRRDESAER
jgi:hypothetical protein